MKRIALTVALVAFSGQAFGADLILTPPAPPEATAPESAFSGHIDGYGGMIYADETGWTVGAAGRANYNFRRRLNIQGDLFGDGIWFDDDTLFGYGAAAHLFWRDPSSYAVGIFGSVEGFDGDRLNYLGDVYRYTVGPEVQAYYGKITLYGQAYFGEVFGEHLEKGVDMWGGRGIVRYFPRENIRLDGELGYKTLQVPGDDFGIITAATQANYRFSGMPLTVFGRYQFENIEPPQGDGIQSHKIVVGLRAHFGSDSLLDEDRHGATMDVGRSNLLFPAF